VNEERNGNPHSIRHPPPNQLTKKFSKQGILCIYIANNGNNKEDPNEMRRGRENLKGMELSCGAMLHSPSRLKCRTLKILRNGGQ